MGHSISSVRVVVEMGMAMQEQRSSSSDLGILELSELGTTVPLAGGDSVQIGPGQPWPSAYRGSKYSLVNHPESDELALKWEHRDLTVYGKHIPGLETSLRVNGKQGGRGSFRVTAAGELLTKIHADSYAHVEQAPVENGWIPVYLGQVDGQVSFAGVEVDPTPHSAGIQVWPGLTANHGEQWTVTAKGRLAWSWRDYRFFSRFDHSELIDRYRMYRPEGGRLYINEHGHVWGNVPRGSVPEAQETEVAAALSDWRNDATAAGNTSTLRLVHRRLEATSRDGDAANGMLPVHLGHLSEFDDGQVPRPIVDDSSYFANVGQYENVSNS
jgi:hypothetical protein